MSPNVDRLDVDRPNLSHVDLHCHTRASRDSIADPVALLARAVKRGLTHLAITDHDTIDGALHAAASAPEGLTVIVGCEVLTTGGDLILLFLERPIPMGLSPREAIAAGREEGALSGSRIRTILPADPSCWIPPTKPSRPRLTGWRRGTEGSADSNGTSRPRRWHAGAVSRGSAFPTRTRCWKLAPPTRG